MAQDHRRLFIGPLCKINNSLFEGRFRLEQGKQVPPTCMIIDGYKKCQSETQLHVKGLSIAEAHDDAAQGLR